MSEISHISAATTVSAYLTVEEAAGLARCHPKTVRRAFKAGDLKGFRPAHRVLLREEDVRAWIESRHQASEASRARPHRARRGRPSPPGSVAALRIMDPDLG